MIRSIIWLAIVLFLSFSSVEGQPNGRGYDPSAMAKDSRISGKVLDKTSSSPVEYATIGIYSARDSSLITGGITDATGVFSIDKLPYGKFYLDISFVGYKKFRINGVGLNPNKKEVNIGEIKLEPAVMAINEVEVVGNRGQVEYKIDKKVINVGSNIVASGGTAADALENTPSVQVDIEGNVSLRGSSNFTVLIDGRPSVLEGSDALQQIPASAIQNIEIITNPSAKYNPEGTSGIINVIMKKQKQLGVNGIVNTSGSTNGSYSGDFLINIRASKLNYYLGANYNDRKFNNSMNSNKETYINDLRDTIYYELANSSGTFNRKGYGIKGGVDYIIDSNNTLSISGNYRANTFGNTSSSLNHNYNSIPGLENNYYLRENNMDRNHDFFETNLVYIRKFGSEGHQLESSLTVSNGPESDISYLNQFSTDELYNKLSNNAFMQRTTDGGEETEYTAKLDYTLPISEKTRFEAGYEGEYSSVKDRYKIEINSGADWIQDASRYNKYDFKNNVQAVYSTYASSIPIFDFQLGLRGEYTNRALNQKVLDKKYSLVKWDFFPTVHISKKLTESLQLQTSYSRRIRRPREQQIDPCEVIIDSRNIRTGNPEITPEYTDSYELNLQRSFKGAGFVSAELFYRHTTDLISNFEYKRSDTISVQTYKNLNDDYSTGFEGMVNMPFTRWWTFNSSISLYNYRIKGNLSSEESVDNNSFSWSTRVSSIFRLNTGTQIQLMGFYNAPNVTAQGRRDGFFFTNIGVKQDLFKRKVSLAVQVRDLFGNSKNQRESSGPYFKSLYIQKREARVFTFTLSFKINNYKPDRTKERDNMNEMEYDGGGDMM